ncbi:hypothetical protein CIB48_g10943 [Xylaria polymorpha]|nr:hypothetical protein CIB48_g10943 [Xylaria polymorpha]
MSPGIKEQMDSLGNSGEFTIREKASQSNFNTAIKETEITITVNCFMKWTHKNNIVVPDFNHAREMTSDLLDNFMEFKNNLSQLAEGDHGETNGLQIIPAVFPNTDVAMESGFPFVSSPSRHNCAIPVRPVTTPSADLVLKATIDNVTNSAGTMKADLFDIYTATGSDSDGALNNAVKLKETHSRYNLGTAPSVEDDPRGAVTILVSRRVDDLEPGLVWAALNVRNPSYLMGTLSQGPLFRAQAVEKAELGASMPEEIKISNNSKLKYALKVPVPNARYRQDYGPTGIPGDTQYTNTKVDEIKIGLFTKTKTCWQSQPSRSYKGVSPTPSPSLHPRGSTTSASASTRLSTTTRTTRWRRTISATRSWLPSTTPTLQTPRGPPQPYLEPELAAIMEAQFNYSAGFLSTFTSTLQPNAPFLKPQAGEPQLPTLLFGPGGGGPPVAGNTILISELVSHGYTVVGLDHPFEQPFIQFPDGTSAVGVEIDYNSLPLLDAIYETRLVDNAVFLKSFPELTSKLGAPFNTTHMGSFGYSLGGAAALAQIYNDGRFVSGLNLDGSVVRDASREQHCRGREEARFPDRERVSHGRGFPARRHVGGLHQVPDRVFSADHDQRDHAS